MSDELLGADARREIGKWLNEEPDREIDRRSLAELCAAYDTMKLEHQRLREAIRKMPEILIACGEVDSAAVTNRVSRMDCNGEKNNGPCANVHSIDNFIENKIDAEILRFMTAKTLSEEQSARAEIARLFKRRFSRQAKITSDGQA